MTTYYFAGSQRVAMCKGGVPTWLVADHLGSTSLALDINGNEVANSRQKYYPFGETRGTATVPTDRQFTGQRAETGLGSLYDYNARMYSPMLGRFISADTIVPDGKNPQQFNRYAYSLNNPVKFTDPTGHYSCYVGASGPMASQSAECVQWVETALGILDTADQLGKDLANFLRAHDELSIVFSAAESYFKAPGSTILISMAFLKENLSAGTGLEHVAAFGHEIEHHRNGDGASIRGEMKAYKVEHQLRDKLHAPVHDIARQLNPLNPYDRNDQLSARTILGDPYDEFPLTPLNEEVPREAFSTVVNFSMGARGVFEEAGGALANLAKIGAYELDKFAKSLAVNLFP